MIICSVIIPTVGRQTLERAVRSALEQLRPGLVEVIVVNDTGRPLEDADWMRTNHVRVLMTNRVERSMARNTGAATAQGKYLFFLDDDDYLLPGALEALIHVAEMSGCSWVYGGLHCVTNDGASYDNLPEVTGNLFGLMVAGETLSLMQSLIRRDAFMRVGGFDPLLTVSEERDLACRILAESDVERTDHFISTVRVGEGSTTDWTKIGQSHRYVRRKAIQMRGATQRIVSAIRDNPAIIGRIFRAYLAAAVDCARHGEVLQATSILVSGIRVAGSSVVHSRFWQKAYPFVSIGNGNRPDRGRRFRV